MRVSWNRGEGALERRQVHGLYEMTIESRGPRALLIFRLAVPSHGNEPQTAQLRYRAQLLREFITVHLREADVEQPDIGLEGFNARERFPSAVSHEGLVSLELKQHSERIRSIGVVIDDQHAARLRFEGRRGTGQCIRPRDPRYSDLECRASARTVAAGTKLSPVHFHVLMAVEIRTFLAVTPDFATLLMTSA